MKSIKTKIISAFLAVIGVMIILLSLVIIIDLNLIKRYERINENIIYEQTLKDGVQLLVESGYSGIKSSDYSKYYERLDEILEIEKILDLRFADADADQEAALAYRSAKNSLAAVISIVEESRENWENTGELTGTSETYQDAIIKFEFVKQSVTELLLSEIKNIAKTTQEIKRIKAFFFVIFGFLVLFITVFLIIFAWLFTKKISDAIVDLSETAEYIIGGDLKIDVNESLLERQDEIGSLSRSFSVMVKNLRDKFSALELSKKKMDDKVKEVSASNMELEKTKTAMVNLLDDANILENSLRKERDRIKTIISSMGEGLIVVNEKNKIILANPIAEKFLEISVKKLLGQDLNKVVPLYSGEEKIDPDKHPIRQALASSQIVVSNLEDNFFLHAASGRKFSTLIVAAPVLGEDLSGAVMMFRDASEEKALDEAKIGFISVASHQLRTPLTSMRWFSEMLIDGDAGDINEEQKHFIERIYQGTERMINLVNLLLQIARVEAGRLKIEPTPIDFKNTTQGVIFTLKANLEAKKQKVEVKTDPDPFPTIPMDQEVIWQVIQNLLSNASRYSPEKSTIYVSVVKKDDFVEYSVKDTGIGIPKDQQAHMFEKFYRAENALKMVPEGSGLGLSLVKMLVERWGGKIWFETKENKGTTFFFTIPFKGMEHKEGEVGLGV